MLIRVLLALSCAALPAAAQILYGGLLGNVSDKSEAVVPGAEVTVTSEQTGAIRTASTSSAGIYQFPTLMPGSYTVSVKSSGFRAYTRKGVLIAANSIARVNATLELGEVTEQVTVEAGTLTLQTEGAEVRREVDRTTLESAPIPLGRNYQSLLGTLPGFSPPQNAHSFPANPSRGLRFSVNGTSDQSNNIRIDGASSYNPNLPHVVAINPTLESLEAVNVITNSFDAEQGLAGGAAVYLQIKSGSNQVHGSAFWYHTNQRLAAYPYFSNRAEPKPKFISNQAGGTIGGPVVRNRVFFFASYERTNENSNAQTFLDVPTAAMRQGNLSGSTSLIYDPLTGSAFNPASPNAYAADRTPFAGNQIPQSRFSAPVRKILALPDWPLPNFAGTGVFGINRNYLAGVQYFGKRDQIDTKVNYNITDKWTAFHRLSYLWFDQNNPAAFGILAGPRVHPTNDRPGFGNGPTWSATASTTYAAGPSLVFDGYFGYTLQDINAGPDGLEQNVSRDLLGIPGTNGATSFSGGMSRMLIDGFAQLGYAQVSPVFFTDHQFQYAANGNWTKGSHSIRFGGDVLRFALNQELANAPGGFGGPAGGFMFRNATTTLRNGPAANDFNSIASFLLGLSREAGRNVLAVPRFETRTNLYSLYIRDRWQISPRLTISFGTRWEYMPFPLRPDRGLERYDFSSNTMLVCGLGSVPRNCGNGASRKMFAPRLGFAWRMNDKLVLRAGYGLTYDPFNLARDLRGNYPTQFAQDLAYPDVRAWSTTLEQGLPATPTAPPGDRIPMPLTAALLSADDNFNRGYIQSWNFTAERQFGDWIASAGYVGSRSIRQISFLNANYAPIGGNVSGQTLVKQFNRTASTQIIGHIGVPKYDSLQTRLQRRMRGYSLSMSYTWSHTRGYTAENSVSTPRVAIPEYWRKNYGPTPTDLRHNLAGTAVMELPFGKGKRWVNTGFASSVLGGWQINTVAALHTGFPVTPTAPGTVLAAPGSGNFADCLGPVEKLGSPNLWWNPASLADPNRVDPRTSRFGTCGAGVLRGPGLINFDLGLFRKFQVTERVTIQFRSEAFNLANTPHFAAPNSDIAASGFGVVNGMQNTGREGIDQRFFRFGLRVGW
ncbi:MAG: TonB-dependent receptor [Acidobacteriia bacterium]|nr:TonB-dependent receptor [Terriglobia bacterium]